MGTRWARDAAVEAVIGACALGRGHMKPPARARTAAEVPSVRGRVSVRVLALALDPNPNPHPNPNGPLAVAAAGRISTPPDMPRCGGSAWFGFGFGFG